MILDAKAMRLFLALLFAGLAFFFSHTASAASEELVVYTYDSLAAKRGLGPIVAKHFEAKKKAEGRSVKVKLVVAGDAAQIYSRLKLDLERKKPFAHVAWGIDRAIFTKMKELVLPLKDTDFAPMSEAVGENELGFVPFDYGVFAFMQDTKKLAWEKRPSDWKDLLDPRLKKNLLLQDPRTSTPGLAFVTGSGAVFGNGFADFWKALRPQWLTLSPGWTQAYGMFLKEEAPLVWSYISSEAYHREEGDASGRYRAVVFSGGNPVQVEGLSILKGAPGGDAMEKLAREFVQTVLSKEMQAELPKTQWMMPARQDAPLPESFRALPKATKLLRPMFTSVELEKRLAEWSAAIR